MSIDAKEKIKVYIIGDKIELINDKVKFVHISDYHDLVLPEPSICILSLPPAQQNEALQWLHKNQSIWHSQLYILQESNLSPYLSDGILDPDALVDNWYIHQSKYALINEEPLDKLLGWLWLDSKRRLIPLCQSDRQDLYHYPLADCYLTEGSNPYAYFQLEEKHGYLELEKTIDKIRLCVNCHSGHLNYIETCPECKNTNIEEMASLHCFTCGHISDEKDFIQQDKLACPNCLTQLRHIGVDYDRPLERYKCGDCNALFPEAVVRARCLSCSLVNDLNRLIARKISQYKAGEQVKNLMMYGRRPLQQELAIDGLIDKKSFHNLLVWVNKLAIRHDQEHLLMSVRLTGIDDYFQQNGEIKRLQLIDEISKRFNDMLRDTDICCHYNSEIILLLMPMTSIDSSPIIKEKINNIANAIDSDLISLNVYLSKLPDNLLNTNASSWLDTLIKESNDE